MPYVVQIDEITFHFEPIRCNVINIRSNGRFMYKSNIAHIFD